MKRAALLFAMLAACEGPSATTIGSSASDGPQPMYRWARDLVIVRHVECAAEADRAVEFWREQGATYLELESVDELPGTIWEQPSGTIDLPMVRPEDIKNARGSTVLRFSTRHEIRAARSAITACDAQLIAHELGHAMGLVHAEEPRVMYPDIGPGIPWEASEAEREWVSQE